MTGAHYSAPPHAPMRSAQLMPAGIRIGVKKEEFLRLLDLIEKPLVAASPYGIANIKLLRFYRYALHYNGFAVHTMSRDALELPAHVNIIEATTIG